MFWPRKILKLYQTFIYSVYACETLQTVKEKHLKVKPGNVLCFFSSKHHHFQIKLLKTHSWFICVWAMFAKNYCIQLFEGKKYVWLLLVWAPQTSWEMDKDFVGLVFLWCCITVGAPCCLNKRHFNDRRAVHLMFSFWTIRLKMFWCVFSNAEAQTQSLNAADSSENVTCYSATILNPW